MITPRLQWTRAPHLVLLKREWTTHTKDNIENQEFEENYNEYKATMVVGDHGAPNYSHFRFRQSLRLPTIVNGVSHLNKCILYKNKNILCNILVVG
jgi:hypothetical protein